MKNTQTIPIVYDEDFFSTNFEPIFTKNYTLFESELQNISEIIKNHTEGRGYLLRAILTKLYKKTDILPHIDIANKTFKYSRITLYFNNIRFASIFWLGVVKLLCSWFIKCITSI